MESKKRKVEKKKSAHAEISEKEIMRNSGLKVGEIRELLIVYHVLAEHRQLIHINKEAKTTR